MVKRQNKQAIKWAECSEPPCRKCRHSANEANIPLFVRWSQFVTANGYEIAGPREEEYQSKPDAKIVKTLIRYQVKKKS